MKVLFAYDSYYKNTKMIAEAMAHSLEKCGAQVYFERIYQVDFTNLTNIDLLVIGAPTHNQNMPRPIKSMLKRLPKGILNDIKTISFDTRYKMNVKKSGSASMRINKLLKKIGARVIVPPESFFVQDRQGPLYPGEIERAQQFATSLIHWQ
jgi:flavorubredoxin